MWNRLAYFRRKNREARTRVSFRLVIFSTHPDFLRVLLRFSYSLFFRIWNLWKRLHISYAQPTTERPLCQEGRAGFSFFHNPVFPGLYILSIIRLAPPGKLQFRLSADTAVRIIGIMLIRLPQQRDKLAFVVLCCHCEPVRTLAWQSPG